jgi:hypothetical protein
VIEVPIFSENVRATIVAALAFSEASGGRVVRTAIKSLGLQVGDLVHPCADIPDTHALETVSLPALAKFWRGDKTHRLKKASPIMEIPGRTTKLLAVDLLHAWHLGPIQYFVGLGLWHLLESRVLTQSALQVGRRRSSTLWAFASCAQSSGPTTPKGGKRTSASRPTDRKWFPNQED